MTSSCGGEEGEIGDSSKEEEAAPALESGRDTGSGSGTGTTGRWLPTRRRPAQARIGPCPRRASCRCPHCPRPRRRHPGTPSAHRPRHTPDQHPVAIPWRIWDDGGGVDGRNNGSGTSSSSSHGLLFLRHLSKVTEGVADPASTAC